MNTIRSLALMALLVVTAPAAAAAGDDVSPVWAVDCLPRITDWVHRAPAASFLFENESPGILALDDGLPVDALVGHLKDSHTAGIVPLALSPQPP